MNPRCRHAARAGGFVAAFWTAAASSAGEASVLTLDGRRFEGKVRLDTNVLIVANLDAAYIAQVDLTNLLSIRFHNGLADANSATRVGSAAASSHPADSWIAHEIGSGSVPGRVDIGRTYVKLTSGAQPAGAAQDAAHLVYTKLAGNGEIVARVAHLQPSHASTRAGIMMRDSASAGAKSVWLALGPQGAAVRWRAEAGQASQQRALPPASRWLRLKREGDQFSSYTSRNGRHWQLLDRATLDMGPTILAGLALAAQTESGVDLLPASTRSANAAAECRFDYVNAGHHLRFHSFVPRIELKGGSELSGDIPSADGRTVVYNSPLGLLTVDQRHIERIDFYWITPTLEKRLEPGRPGVLLANGEFVEGEFKGLKDGMCTISSVLFGLRRFDTANEVLSIVFSRNPTPPSEPEFEVHTWAGSIWRGRIQSMNASGVILVDPILGRQSVAYFELKELTRQPGS